MKFRFLLATAGATALVCGPGAHAAAPPLDAYGELPGVEDIAVAPDGHAIASIVQVAGERHVVAIDDAGKILLNAATGPSKVRSVEWADNTMVLVTKTETVSLGMDFVAPKYELTGTIIVPLDGRKSELVFGRTKAIAHTTRGRFGIRQVEGKTVGYFGGIALDVDVNGAHFRHGRTTLYAVDLARNLPRQVGLPPSEDHYRDWLIDAAGQVAITLDISETNGRWTVRNGHGVDLANGTDIHGDVSLICFGKDGSSVLYSINDADGDTHWFEIPINGGAATEFLPGENVERLYVDARNSQLLGYRLKGDTPKTVMFDPVQQSAVTRILRAFGKRDAALMDWSTDFTKVIVRTSGSNDSGTWFLVDVSKHKADPIGDEREKITAEDVGPVSMITYKASDGLEMDGVLTLPPGRPAKNLPVVVLPHGGPAAHDIVEFDWWAQAFASRGYAVFQPNFRGSTGRTDAFQRAGDGEWGHKMQTDISDGLAELARQGVVDPKRACIVGASYGGYAALAGVALQHGIYRCAVSVAGISDVDLMYHTEGNESGDTKMTWASLKRQLGSPKGFDAISPRRFAATVEAPVLLIHGKDDTVVALKQSQVMADALKDAHKPYQFVVLPGEDHWLSRSETRKQMLQASVEFVQKNNPAD